MLGKGVRVHVDVTVVGAIGLDPDGLAVVHGVAEACGGWVGCADDEVSVIRQDQARPADTGLVIGCLALCAVEDEARDAVRGVVQLVEVGDVVRVVARDAGKGFGVGREINLVHAVLHISGRCGAGAATSRRAHSGLVDDRLQRDR